MRRTFGKKLRMIAFAAVFGCLLAAKGTVASAATEAVYEYDDKTEGKDVIKGVITTYGLNVRTAPGKDNPVVKIDDEGVALDKNDHVAIIGEGESSGQVWFKVSFKRGENLIVGYVHSSYVTVTEEILPPIATPTPIPTPSPTPEPATPTPEPETPTPTLSPEESGNNGTTENNGGNGGGIIAILVVVAIAMGALVALWYLKKRNDDGKGAETNEKIDNLKNMTLPNAPLSPDGTPIAVMKRREVVTEPAEDYRRQPIERQDETSILADRERARLMNEEMIRQSRNGENVEEEAKLKEIAATLKEKEVVKEEIDRLRIGDMVYHEYFGKGIVRDNSDVKVIEISFGQDVRFLNKVSCAAKRLLRKL